MSSTAYKRGAGKKLPLPPYGATIIEMIRRGEKPNVFVIAGSNAWERFKLRAERLVLTPGSDPADFDWSFLRGLEPLVVGDDAPIEVLHKLAWCLLRAGCPLVCVCYDDIEATDERSLDARVTRGTVVRTQFFRNE